MATTISSDFEWTRAFAKAGNQAGAYSCSGGEIRQIGRGKERYRPLATNGIYLRFAALDGSPASCVAFANTWGLLEKPASLTTPPSEPLEFWRRAINRMKTLSRALPNVVRIANSRGTYAVVGSLNVLLVPGGPEPDAKPALVMEPQSLLQAMNLQLALWVAGGGSLAICEQCKEPFQAGIGSKRRSIAKFCSVACKNRHHYEQRMRK
jgi:hypothetical protein